MSKTPEGKVKAKITELLQLHKAHYFMPVQGGYGAPALDYIVCSKGRYAQIEAKAGNGKMTPRQHAIAMHVERASGVTFLINEDPTSMGRLAIWLALDSE